MWNTKKLRATLICQQAKSGTHFALRNLKRNRQKIVSFYLKQQKIDINNRKITWVIAVYIRSESVVDVSGNKHKTSENI